MLGDMKVAYHVLLNLLGVGCIAACIGIVATMGELNIHWSGWIAVGFFAVLALGIVCGWFPWRGRPLRVMLKGVYVMSAFALMGFGFKLADPLRPQLWMIVALLGAAIAARIIIRIMFHLRDKDEPAMPERPARPASDDPLFG